MFQVMLEGGYLWGILFFASAILSAPSLNKPSISDTADTIDYAATSTNTFKTNSSNAGGSMVSSTRRSITVSNIGNFKTNGSNDTR